MEDIYYSVLSPAQALLMKYGHQPTDPLETIKKFKTQLNSMNREFSKHTNTLQLVYDKRKYLEHNVEEEVDLKNLDKLIEATKLFNELIDKLSKEKDLEFKRDKMKHIQKIISKILAMMVIQFGETSNNAIKDIQLLVNEGVISNHSQVAAKGELPYLEKEIMSLQSGNLTDKELNNIRVNYFNSVDVDGGYVTDKMPLNFRWVGFIKTCFPEAKIIHCQKDAMSVCWSIYKQNWFCMYIFC